MRTPQEDSFYSLPSNIPLRSPSPDLQNKNSIIPTRSPYQSTLHKTPDQFTPQSRSKKQTYMEFNTLPQNTQLKQFEMESKIQNMFQSNKLNSQQFCQAKGDYNFQMPKQYLLRNEERYQSEQIQTHKKNQYNQKKKIQPLEQSPMIYHSNKIFVREEALIKQIEKKDLIISELKVMIDMLTENGKHLKNSKSLIIQEQYNAIKNQNKILNIENQKLSEVIERFQCKSSKATAKMNSIERSQSSNDINQRANIQQSLQNDSLDCCQNCICKSKELSEKIEKYKEQIEQLKQALNEKQSSHYKQIDDLINSHKSLAMECKIYETQKERFSKENQRLINLLKLKEKQKETCYANYSYVNKSQYEYSQQPFYPKNPTALKVDLQLPSKLTIQKIKAQYDENLRQQKQNIQNEVQTMFHIINSTLDEIKQRLNTFQERLSNLQSFKNLLRSKVASNLISSEQNEEQIKKSAIYIQEGPSSQRFSNQQKSRQALSIILEESQRGNEKFELQISQLRKQVQFYKNKIQGTFSQKKIAKVYSQEQIQAHQEKIKELEDLVDELREQKDTYQKKIAQLETEFVDKQSSKKIVAGTLKYQTQIFDNQTAQQNLDGNSMIGQLNCKITELAEKLSRQQQEEFKFRAIIKDLEKSQDIREKELFLEIERFQLLIKQTEETFNHSKEENQFRKLQFINQIECLNKQLGILQQKTSESQKHYQQKILTLQTRLSQTLNEKINQQQKYEHQYQDFQSQKKELESELNQIRQQSQGKDFLIMELQQEKQNTKQTISQMSQKLQKVRASVLQFREKLSKGQLCLEIQDYVMQLEKTSKQLMNQKSSLFKVLESQRDEVLQLKQVNIELRQKIVSSEKIIEVYKNQLEQTRSNYQSHLVQLSFDVNHQKSTYFPQLSINFGTSQESQFRTRFDGLIAVQHNKIRSLLDDIDDLTSHQVQGP